MSSLLRFLLFGFVVLLGRGSAIGSPVSFGQCPRHKAVVRIQADVPGIKADRVGAGYIRQDGRVVTAYHVIQGSYDISVTTLGYGTSNAVRVVYADPKHDVAMLDVGALGKKFKANRWGLQDAARHRPGPVCVHGHPVGDDYRSFTAQVGGLTSGSTYRDMRTQDPFFTSKVDSDTFLQVLGPVAAAGPGSSGGPVVTYDGKVLGIVVSILPGAANAVVAVPVERFKDSPGGTSPVDHNSGVTLYRGKSAVKVSSRRIRGTALTELTRQAAAWDAWTFAARQQLFQSAETAHSGIEKQVCVSADLQGDPAALVVCADLPAWRSFERNWVEFSTARTSHLDILAQARRTLDEGDLVASHISTAEADSIRKQVDGLSTLYGQVASRMEPPLAGQQAKDDASRLAPTDWTERYRATELAMQYVEHTDAFLEEISRMSNGAAPLFKTPPPVGLAGRDRFLWGVDRALAPIEVPIPDLEIARVISPKVTASGEDKTIQAELRLPLDRQKRQGLRFSDPIVEASCVSLPPTECYILLEPAKVIASSVALEGLANDRIEVRVRIPARTVIPRREEAPVDQPARVGTRVSFVAPPGSTLWVQPDYGSRKTLKPVEVGQSLEDYRWVFVHAEPVVTGQLRYTYEVRGEIKPFSPSMRRELGLALSELFGESAENLPCEWLRYGTALANTVCGDGSCLPSGVAAMYDVDARSLKDTYEKATCEALGSELGGSSLGECLPDEDWLNVHGERRLCETELAKPPSPFSLAALVLQEKLLLEPDKNAGACVSVKAILKDIEKSTSPTSDPGRQRGCSKGLNSGNPDDVAAQIGIVASIYQSGAGGQRRMIRDRLLSAEARQLFIDRMGRIDEACGSGTCAVRVASFDFDSETADQELLDRAVRLFLFAAQDAEVIEATGFRPTCPGKQVYVCSELRWEYREDGDCTDEHAMCFAFDDGSSRSSRLGERLARTLLPGSLGARN